MRTKDFPNRKVLPDTNDNSKAQSGLMGDWLWGKKGLLLPLKLYIMQMTISCTCTYGYMLVLEKIFKVKHD